MLKSAAKLDSNETIVDTLAEEIRRQAEGGLERLDVDTLMALSPFSRRQTERLFRERLLTSPARYFRDCQWEQARQRLRQGDDVLAASTKAGFASPGRLHDAALARAGMTPGEVRRGGEGVQIRCGFFETQVGIVFIAATSRGLCTLRLCGAAPAADELATHLGDLRREYPQASVEEDTAPLQTYADQLVAFLEARSPAFCPPLDILRGTAFQRAVWDELRKVQPGETISYSDLAARVGRPEAVRAVAQACARNNVAIAIPCHRCVRADGDLAGYRWGIAWKRKLLALEAESRGR